MSSYSVRIASSFISATRRSTAACSRSLRSFSICTSFSWMSLSSTASRSVARSAFSLEFCASRSQWADACRFSSASDSTLASLVRSCCSSSSSSARRASMCSMVSSFARNSPFSIVTVSCSCLNSVTEMALRAPPPVPPAAVSLSEVELNSSMATPPVPELERIEPGTTMPAGDCFCLSRTDASQRNVPIRLGPSFRVGDRFDGNRCRLSFFALASLVPQLLLLMLEQFPSEGPIFRPERFDHLLRLRGGRRTTTLLTLGRAVVGRSIFLIILVRNDGSTRRLHRRLLQVAREAAELRETVVADERKAGHRDGHVEAARQIQAPIDRLPDGPPAVHRERADELLLGPLHERIVLRLTDRLAILIDDFDHFVQTAVGTGRAVLGGK
uniref:Uncharacterized protein n=1 Tax=Anopheles atroparvus TaxID=41427 RepID=A0A182JFU6_ANOAO